MFVVLNMIESAIKNMSEDVKKVCDWAIQLVSEFYYSALPSIL